MTARAAMTTGQSLQIDSTLEAVVVALPRDKLPPYRNMTRQISGRETWTYR